MGLIKALKCRQCGREYQARKIYACEDCFGPLDVIYNYDSIQIDKRSIRSRPRSLWRYIELLPISDPSKIIDLGAGYTPLRKAERLGKILELTDLYIKNDTVNPTYSFKDRPASVAVSKALEFNAEVVGCASTGNLAAATAAHAAKAGLPCYVFVPSGIEVNKIVQAAAYGATIVEVDGTYDDANRLAAQVAEAYDWAFVNINIRPYYVEGSKTLAFEVWEQLDWSLPDHVIIPVGSGALLCAVCKGFDELKETGLTEDSKVIVHGAQPYGCSPVATAFKKNEELVPVERPETIAKSLAIGDPGDGIYALERIRNSGGQAEWATDGEIVEAIKLLAKIEGVFAEPAGAVTIAVLKKLVEGGNISHHERVICYVTGNGLKTSEAIVDHISKPIGVKPSLDSFGAKIKALEALTWSR